MIFCQLFITPLPLKLNLHLLRLTGLMWRDFFFPQWSLSLIIFNYSNNNDNQHLLSLTWYQHMDQHTSSSQPHYEIGILLLFSFYRWVKWGMGRLSNLPKRTLLVGGKGRHSITGCWSLESPQLLMLSQGCSHFLVIFTTSVINFANKNTCSLLMSPYY